MTDWVVDLVIACHDPRRPIARAVSSVLGDEKVREQVRVTVVAHGIEPHTLRDQLDDYGDALRVVPFADGIRSAAGPFNHGLELATAEYVSVMGSDDFLEPGTMAEWVSRVRADRPDAALAQIRLQGAGIMPNPLVRLRRSRNLDAARDRLFYRTAPLGLIRTVRMREMQLRMVSGVRVGEDFDFGIRLWAHAGRVDLLRGAGCYVIGEDAAERTTLAAMTMAERLEAIVDVCEGDIFESLSARYRHALAVKLLRVTVLGNTVALVKELSDDDVRQLSSLAATLVRLAPRALRPFNIQDRTVLDELLSRPTSAALQATVARSRAAGRRQRWLTPDIVHSFDRESTLRRYVLYFLMRERGRRTR